MRGWGARNSVVLGAALVAAALPGGTAASESPAQDGARSEVTQLELAAGFRAVNGRLLNSCGKQAEPRIGFIDLSGDGRAETIVLDNDPSCYGQPGDWFAILTRGAAGEWRLLARSPGKVRFERSRTHGWSDAKVSGACAMTLRFNGAVYQPDRRCAGPMPAKAASVPPR
ncbi:MAG: hypothetical protein JSR21_11065 [Proteobacteria bacterium]|nr:hypothetical protein [Pseudomonadota bacterium]